MFPRKPLYLAIAGCLACSFANAADLTHEEVETANVMLASPVVVTATRIEQNSFDLPVSIDVVDSSLIRDNQLQVNLSETAVRIPGIVMGNRNNPAQDLSISTRGFGARSLFGVRGIRLYADGIPMSMPDGQGQTGTFNLDTAKQVEFMRGPFSVLYGNSSGGVVQLFTKDGGKTPEISGTMTFGSYDTRRQSLTLSGEEGIFNYVVNAAHYSTDGFRVHSDGTRDTLHGKFTLSPSDDLKLTLVATALDQPESQDPFGLTRAQYLADPSKEGTHRFSGKTATERNSHVDRSHAQTGMTVDYKINSENSIKLMGYLGRRENLQYLISGNASGIDRNYGGIDARWTYQSRLADQPFTFTAGMNYDEMEDKRKSYPSPNGFISGPASRFELQSVHNFDQFAQATWEPSDKWFLTGGLRRTKVFFEVDDKVFSDGDQSGSANFSNTSSAVGATFRLLPAVNLYANYGEGFETPTFVEMTYAAVSPTLVGPNLTIQPSKSKHYEFGVKAFVFDNTRINASLFKIDTEKEIVVRESAGGSTAYMNAGDTERRGLELSLDSALPHDFSFYAAYTLMDAEFRDPFRCAAAATSWCTPGNNIVTAGKKIPYTYTSTTYAELSWKHAPTGFSTAIEGMHFSKSYVNDLNNEWTEPYTVFNWRAGFKQGLQHWEFNEFVRVDNLTDQTYIGSIRPNDADKRFYEPGMPRNWTVGLGATYKF